MGHKTVIKKTEHYVHNGEQSEQETNTTKSGAKVNRERIQKLKYNSYNPKYKPTETKYQREEILRGQNIVPSATRVLGMHMNLHNQSYDQSISIH